MTEIQPCLLCGGNGDEPGHLATCRGRSFVVIKFQPWGDSVLLTSLAWMQLDDISKATAPVYVCYFPSFAEAAEAVAMWPEDGCTGVVPRAAISVLDRPDVQAAQD